MKLKDLNTLTPEHLREELKRCCGSDEWTRQMSAFFPVKNETELFLKAESVWNDLEKKDWLEAFTHHPKIGDVASLTKKFASTAQWASGEQSAVNNASQDIIAALAEGNRLYEDKFGFIFIVCATGKSAEEMLDLLQKRLPNNKDEEIIIAAGEQNKITKIRLQKLLS